VEKVYLLIFRFPLPHRSGTQGLKI